MTPEELARVMAEDLANAVKVIGKLAVDLAEATEAGDRQQLYRIVDKLNQETTVIWLYAEKPEGYVCTTVSDKECPDCDGTGGQPVRCENCRGLGVVYA